jgi:hypothetical protein
MHGVVPNRIEREILVDAPLDVVWAVVTDPEHVAGWFSDSVVLDLRPGGKAILTWDEHGTGLRVVESGFADLAGPDDEMAKTVDEHREGWRLELGDLSEYVAERVRTSAER